MAVVPEVVRGSAERVDEPGDQARRGGDHARRELEQALPGRAKNLPTPAKSPPPESRSGGRMGATGFLHTASPSRFESSTDSTRPAELVGRLTTYVVGGS